MGIEAMKLADALDAEFVQGRISNSTGRESAVELRRLHEVNQELLEALKHCSHINGFREFNDYLPTIRAAIDKATGEKS